MVKVVPREVIDRERGKFHAGVEPRDAATLIIVDRSSAELKVLLGRRHARHVFMPGKFVFPGGRVDAQDREMSAAKPMHADVERKLTLETNVSSGAEACAFGLAAIRETFEETGLLVGIKGPVSGNVPAGPWTRFVESGIYPDLSGLQFIGRAVTPPGYPRRFDARFFTADAASIALRLDNVVHADAELTELVWLPIAEARQLDLPIITGIMLDQLESRVAKGFRPDLPVPFYGTKDGDFLRGMLD